jgi:hypothetical protein
MEIAGLGGAEAGGEGGLNGAGPAGWLRESGSRLPQSKVTAAVTEEGLVGRGADGDVGGPGACGEGGLNGAGPAGWLRESGSRLPQSKVTAAVTEGGLVGRGRVGR